jgi:predicted O-methyltransferase YrrM
MIRNSRLVKVKSYFSPAGLRALVQDTKYLLRRGYLGLPRVDISELFDLEERDFRITIPNHTHGSTRNASLSVGEKLFIALLCHKLQPERVIEVGTFRGETTDLMANNLCSADIYTLDLPPDFTEHEYMPDADDLGVLKLRKPASYIQTSYETGSRIHQVFGDSATFDFNALGCEIELAFIDGAHSYEYVKNDTERIAPLMRPGGWIVWDDYSFSFPGVIKYVNTLRNKGAFHIYGTRLAAMKV